MTLRFTKMEGCGNDYVYVSLFTERLDLDDAPRLAREMSRPRFGIGGDGLIVIGPSSIADCRMHMWNADGSRGAMCGNGIRCVGKLVHDRGWVRMRRLRVETDSGVKDLELCTEDGAVTSARVDMGVPVLERDRIPARGTGVTAPAEKLALGNQTFDVSLVSMGNPHCVVFLGDQTGPLEEFPVSEIGARIGAHPMFLDRANVEFVRRAGSGLAQRTFERGSGETLACGTGACAAVVAATRRDWFARGGDVPVVLRGGTLTIRWCEDDRVLMTGPAREVFTGDWPWP